LERDIEDFDAAIREGAIRPPDADAARLAHQRMREVIREYCELTKAEREALPADVLDDAKKAVFPSEFADYHAGVMAYSSGEHAAARAAWEHLLARPEAERQYRSVQAAYMIGVLGVIENWDDTPRWFEMARDFALRGFHDDAGLAAATYRWEGGWYQGHGNLRVAAECALRSISAGYPGTSCVDSADDSPEELAKFAIDPLLRRIHTSLLLAEQTPGLGEQDEKARARLDAWLRAVETVGVREFAGAERIGWLCYNAGNFAAARGWLARAPRKSPHALWLAGKLAARDGDRAASLRAFSTASRLLVHEPEPALEVTNLFVEENTPAQTMAADHAIAAIGAAEFRVAFEAFLRGGHWTDAAFVAERLLSIGELRDFVAKRLWKEEWADEETPELDGADAAKPAGETMERLHTRSLRWLLARRLARAGRFAKARPFFPPKWRIPLDRYAQALSRSEDRSLSAEVRALALWDAAVETRHHGIELLGTEAAPDWFLHGGDFEEDDPAPCRLGYAAVMLDRYSEHPKSIPLPAILKAGTAERARLHASAIEPGKRYHYRYRAAALAWRAAKLLPDDDARTAAMLNIAGLWLTPRDDDAADRFYQQLESRCGKTELGQRATARRWFVEPDETTVRRRPELVPTE
ncbi:MAG TPA: hypothetical protein VFD27_16905, partial [Chthoniobacteraceae bacterium]|nr:hypothetical protein [Chthoniobacteraceae bacterium]